MNLIWYMVPEYPSNFHLRQATLSVSGGLQGQSAIVSSCRAGQQVQFLNKNGIFGATGDFLRILNFNQKDHLRYSPKIDDRILESS